MRLRGPGRSPYQHKQPLKKAWYRSVGYLYIMVLVSLCSGCPWKLYYWRECRCAYGGLVPQTQVEVSVEVSVGSRAACRHGEQLRFSARALE